MCRGNFFFFSSEVLQCVKQEKKNMMNLFGSIEDMKIYIYFCGLAVAGKKMMSEKEKRAGNWNGLLPIFTLCWVTIHQIVS